MERLDAAIVVGGPTAVLVATDLAFEPIHKKSTVDSLQLTVQEGKKGQEKAKNIAETQRRGGTKKVRSAQDDSARGGFGGGTVRHETRERGGLLRQCDECGTLLIAAASRSTKLWSLPSFFYLG